MVPSTIALTIFLTFIQLVLGQEHDTARRQNRNAWTGASCRKIAPLENFEPKNFGGIWYEHYTQDPSVMDRRCIQSKVTVLDKNKGFIIESRYNNACGVKTELRRAIPVLGKTGVYTVYTKDANGNWSTDGWKFVSVAQLDNGNMYLEFSCKVVGSTKYEYFYMRSRFSNMSKADFNTFRKIAKKNKSFKIFVNLSEKNCHYTLNESELN